MNETFLPILTQFGGLGVLALFAWLLLKNTLDQQRDFFKSTIEQQQKLAEMIGNHMTSLLEQMRQQNNLLSSISDKFHAHWEEFKQHDERGRH